jgi:hypothetical protein
MVFRSCCALAILVSVLVGCSNRPAPPTTAGNSPPAATNSQPQAVRGAPAQALDSTPIKAAGDATHSAADAAATSPAEATGSNASEPKTSAAANPANGGGNLESSAAGTPSRESSPSETPAAVAGSDNNPLSDDPANNDPTGDNLPPSARRLLLLGPDGPLLIELQLTINGQPFDAPMRRLIDEAMKAADTNGDGVPTWDELTASPAFRYGTYGNQPIATLAERQTVKTTYDGGGGDGRVARHELGRFLNSNQGGGAAFTLTSSNQYRGDNQTKSLIKRLLDWDEDESLSLDEWEAAGPRLRSRDNDEDDILFLDDFKATSNLASPFGQPNMRARIKRYGPDSAILLDANTNWNNLLVAFKELYTLGGNVGAEPFSLTPGTFERLDSDGNGVLQVSELTALQSVPPHLTLAAHFGGPSPIVPAVESDSPAEGDAPRTDLNPAGPLELVAMSPDLERLQPTVTRSPGRLVVTLPGVDLLVYISDTAPQDDFERQAQMQLMALDTDSNGYLDKDELAASGDGQFPLEAIDSDGDGKVFLGELRDLLGRRQNASRSQLRAYAADQEDALFSALDADNDGRLTTREIDGAAALLRRLDRNQDERLSDSEIPGSMQVAITRGAAMMANAPPPPAYLSTSQDTEVPAWFRNMDTNQDGDVSRLEFLGEQETFERLDGNQDGFLSAGEAAKLASSRSE